MRRDLSNDALFERKEKKRGGRGQGKSMGKRKGKESWNLIITHHISNHRLHKQVIIIIIISWDRGRGGKRKSRLRFTICFET